MKLFQKDKSFYKKVLILALPIALQSLIAVGVNMLDTIMVGGIGSAGNVYDAIDVGVLGKTEAQLVSEQSLSAVSLSNTFIGIYHIFCMGQPVEEQKTEETTDTPPSPASRIINFFDEKNELQLSLRLDHIYFIESAENYVNIYYRNKENTERFTLRSSLKKQQEKLEKFGFIRCHRSYLVNLNFIF